MGILPPHPRGRRATRNGAHVSTSRLKLVYVDYMAAGDRFSEAAQRSDYSTVDHAKGSPSM
jgi:hypothetical protein